MKNKKIIIAIMATIIILLAIIICEIIFNLCWKIDIFNFIKNSDNNTNEYELISKVNNEQQNNELDNELDAENVSNVLNSGDIQNIRLAAVNQSEITNNVSSRSEVDRQSQEKNSEELCVNVNPNSIQISQDEYEEIITYTKLEDVKISFDMDVSKTTGLSRDDFIYLVKKIKYDKTGILEKNAGWIWDCCQKYNVNEIFVLGICGIESGWCSAPQHQKTHNYSSLMSGGKLISYATDEQGFEAMIKLLGQKYLSPNGSLYHGATITGVGKCYCNPTSWPQKVYKCMRQALE